MKAIADAITKPAIQSEQSALPVRDKRETRV